MHSVQLYCRRRYISSGNCVEKVLCGRRVADQLLRHLAPRVTRLREAGVTPLLVPILVGDDPSSISYISRKRAAATRVGVEVHVERLPKKASFAEVFPLIQRLNEDPAVHGIIVQLPLPEHLCERTLCNSVDPSKDVDGFTAVNLGSLVQVSVGGDSSFIPCTALAVKSLLDFYFAGGVGIRGKRAVVVGRSMNVGLPIAMVLQGDSKKGGYDMTTTITHRKTENLAMHTRCADLLVSATGVPGLVISDMVKPGCVVIDVGLCRTNDGLVGDVTREAKEVAGFATPVPGGVGPCTVACLMHNTVLAAARRTL